MSDLEKFRAETRAWLEENCPPSMRTPMPEDETCWGGRNPVYKNPDTKLWMDRMGARGWTVPTWPKEYGGGGLDKAQNQVLQQELGRLRARPPLSSFGIWMLGPALLEFASEEQKRHYLPQIARGEIRWCQGYSEPGAGSDLAGLQTKAEDMGDHYLVNGSKIWTSYGNYADWIFCLVRTDAKAPKHQGISFLLFDMTTPGVSTKPIRLISGASVFAETFFDNVKVPKHQLVGTLNAGWTIAKALLQHERNMIGGMGGANMPGSSGLRSPSVAAKRYSGEIKGKISNPALRLEIAKHNMNSRAFGVTGQRMADEMKAGAPPGPASSMFKYYGTEQNKRKYELLLAAMGAAALGWEGKGFEEHELGITREWLRSKGNSIEGGTSEVQLNIIAKNVLRLPD